MPPQMVYIAVIKSIAYVIATFAAQKRIKCFKAYSGRWKSRNDAVDLNMLIAKKRTNKPSPIAWSPPFMPEMTFQIAPPLKFCGEVVINDHISVILSFQVENAFSRLATIQLSLKGNSPPVLKRKNSHNRW